MTTTTDAIPPVTLEAGRPGPARFLVSFAVGLAAALLLAVAALYVYDRTLDGRVLNGVRVGAVDLGGLAPAAARERLLDAYGSVAQGTIVLTTPDGSRTVPFSDAGRYADVDAMLAQAISFGRDGTLADRLVGNVTTAVRGAALEPIVVYDEASLAAAVERAAARYDIRPTDASVAAGEGGFVISKGQNGRRADREAAMATLLAAMPKLDTPARLEVDLPLVSVEPAVTTQEALQAKTIAERIAEDVVLEDGKDTWSIPGATVYSWISFATGTDGTYQPVVDTSGLSTVLAEIAKKTDRAPKDASFLVGKSGQIVGVTAGADGRALDVAATALKINQALRARAAWTSFGAVPPVFSVVKPALSTEEAEKAAPLMEKVSSWKTYFPISEKNGFGANIWIPASLIDGYVVAPGATFDFWQAVGPVTREKGYRAGGAIINGRTEPQGALAGGICSCSTTLFNAALRAGYKMGARRNHYYYIDRYPLGLDATVFISASGSRQTMSWTNDTPHPVLIRGINTRKGNDGWVTFELYSVPTGRKVSFSKPIVKNVRPASDSVEYTTSLAAGVKKRIEYPVDGKDVWVTRTVTDAKGSVIHKETYYSHYARITGVVLIGKAATPPPPAAPTPTPAPPTPAPPAEPTPTP